MAVDRRAGRSCGFSRGAVAIRRGRRAGRAAQSRVEIDDVAQQHLAHRAVGAPCRGDAPRELEDALVQLESSNYLICRESHKPFPFPYDKAWTDQYTNGDFVPAIADLIIKLINKKATGVFNVGTDVKTWQQLTGAEPISKPDSAPADVTMNTTKMKNFLK